MSIYKMKPRTYVLGFQQGYKDSNLENDGIRIRCLTIWL